MKAEQTFAIDFIARMCKQDKTSSLLFARITVNGDRKEISLKENIKTKNWDSAREMVRGNSIDVKAINKHIDEMRFRLKEKYRMLEEKHCDITAETIKEAYLGTQASQKTKHTICELVKYHGKIEGEKKRSPILSPC